MTPIERLERARRHLATTAALAPFLTWLGRGLAWLAVTALVARLVADAHAVRLVGQLGALLIAGVAGAHLVAAWRRTTTADAALWIERHVPALEFALVTLADPRAQLAPATRQRLASRADRVRWEPDVTRAARAATAGR